MIKRREKQEDGEEEDDEDEEEGKLDISDDILQTRTVLQTADHQHNGCLKVWHL